MIPVQTQIGVELLTTMNAIVKFTKLNDSTLTKPLIINLDIKPAHLILINKI